MNGNMQPLEYQKKNIDSSLQSRNFPTDKLVFRLGSSPCGKILIRRSSIEATPKSVLADSPLDEKFDAKVEDITDLYQ